MKKTMKRNFLSFKNLGSLTAIRYATALSMLLALTQLPPFGGIEGGFCQNVGINEPNPDASALLELTADDMGILIPRVSLTSTTDVATITGTEATSLIVYNTNAAMTNGTGAGFYWWDGSKWRPVVSPDDAGSSGEVLTSQGTGTPPQWQPLSSGGGCGGCPTEISLRSPTTSNWGGRALYCRTLVEGGNSDWRMPTIEELTYAAVYLDISGGTGDYLWTSTRNDLTYGFGTGSNTQWLRLALSVGNWGSDTYSSSHYVRCVR